jgi:hypothetical protein
MYLTNKNNGKPTNGRPLIENYEREIIMDLKQKRPVIFETSIMRISVIFLISSNLWFLKEYKAEE